MIDIIIPVYNLKEYTRRCLQSIREWTKIPHQIIIVDNGSNQETQEYLQSLKKVQIIHNKRNLGYPRACNQGIRASKGKYVMLLNNDTIVTWHWLENLIHCLEDYKTNAMAGPLTNGIANPKQRYELEFDTKERLYTFARLFNQRDPRCYFELEYLSGFCLLIKREVLEEVGLLDESFGLALQEDYDLCKRVRLAGYQTLCAGDTFVYHYYSQTFIHHRMDREKMLKESLKKYQEKWRRDQ